MCMLTVTKMIEMEIRMRLIAEMLINEKTAVDKDKLICTLLHIPNQMSLFPHNQLLLVGLPHRCSWATKSCAMPTSQR